MCAKAKLGFDWYLCSIVVMALFCVVAILLGEGCAQPRAKKTVEVICPEPATDEVPPTSVGTAVTAPKLGTYCKSEFEAKVTEAKAKPRNERTLRDWAYVQTKPFGGDADVAAVICCWSKDATVEDWLFVRRTSPFPAVRLASLEKLYLMLKVRNDQRGLRLAEIDAEVLGDRELGHMVAQLRYELGRQPKRDLYDIVSLTVGVGALLTLIGLLFHGLGIVIRVPSASGEPRYRG